MMELISYTMINIFFGYKNLHKNQAVACKIAQSAIKTCTLKYCLRRTIIENAARSLS